MVAVAAGPLVVGPAVEVSKSLCSDAGSGAADPRILVAAAFEKTRNEKKKMQTE